MITLCIAGKNNIAVDVLDEAFRRYRGKIRFLAVVNKTEQYTDSWQKSYGKYCQEHNIPIVPLDKIYRIEDLCFLSLEFDQIVRPELFSTDRLFNVHFSKLPAYKGMYTSILPILNDETESGVTLHRIRAGIDTGEIIDQITISISFEMTAFQLYRAYISNGTELALRNLDNLLFGAVESVPQAKEHSSYYPKQAIDFNTIGISPKQTAAQIHNYIRAFAFRPYQLVKFHGIDVINSEITSEVSHAAPGEVLAEDEDTFRIATIDYDLIIYKDTIFKEMGGVSV